MDLVRRKARTAVVGAVATVCLAGTASGSVFQVDINALSAEVSGPFSTNFTGTLEVFNTAARPDIDFDARILDVLIDGTTQNTGGADWDEFSFLMLMDFVNGRITGGTIMLSEDPNKPQPDNTYTADIVASAGASIIEGGGVFLIGGTTENGMWSDPTGTFLGVEVTPWGRLQPVPGYFFQIELDPNGNLLDRDTDVDLFIIPSPGAVALLFGAGLAVVYRRRR